MELQVSFRGKQLTLSGVGPGTTLSVLKEQLQELTSVPVANQKLIFKGKALHEDSITLDEAGVIQAQPGSPKPRLMLVGSTASEVEAARGPPKGRGRGGEVRNDLDGVVIPKGYKRVSLNYGVPPPDTSPYRFERIETLPGLPEEDTARGILESLAADPGVRAVMQKHRWTVGALCELYPEGKVGVSDVCVMGLNQNHGMKILLRLRTDDLKGFRKILSIRKVLFHELAHNEFSEHDDNFYRLMRQIEREVSELDWRQQGGRSLGGPSVSRHTEVDGGSGGGYVLVKESFQGGSGRIGGDSEALTHMFSARELAGQAAIQRLTLEEKIVEDGCGLSHRNRGSAAPVAAPKSPSTTRIEATEAVAPRKEADDNDAAHETSDHEALVAPNQSADGREVPETEASPSRMDTGSPVHGRGEQAEGAGGGGVETNMLGTDSMDVDTSRGGNTTPETRPASVDGEQAGSLGSPIVDPATVVVDPLDELLAMGFPRDTAAAALAASGGSIPEAAHRLISEVPSGSGEQAAAAAESAGHDAIRPSRDVRLQRAVARIAEHGDVAAAVQCTETLIGVFRNLMEHPGEPKYRSIRRSNRKFKASVGSVPGGIDVLLAAGFEERGEDQLELGRRDPGLLWLARSTLEAGRGRLGATA